MNEILIEEKKYISSKQAAKVTGYAKDYIGQLCREGRVPARLIGRSWYVLEAAIHDHRFGDQKSEEEKSFSTELTEEIPVSIWESPRYEASSVEVLPSINRIQDSEKEQEPPEAQQHPQDSWKNWFDRATAGMGSHASPTSAPDDSTGDTDKKDEGEVEIEVEKGVQVAIRAAHKHEYEPLPDALLPHRADTDGTTSTLESELKQTGTPEVRRGGRILIQTIQISGVLAAVLMVTLAVIGSGYFDKYISSRQAALISGFIIYNK